MRSLRRGGQREPAVCGQGEEVLVVADQEHDRAVGRDLPDLVRDGLQVASVDTGAGLVEDHDAPAGDADGGDDEALLLASGEGERVPLCEVGEVEGVEHRRGVGGVRRAGAGELDLGPDAVGEQLPLHVLHDDRAEPLACSRADDPAVQAHPAGGTLQAGDDPGEGGLADSVDAADRGDRPAANETRSRSRTVRPPSRQWMPVSSRLPP
ncbi:hypothetical protein BJF78_13365 [Pseudonocardia sp. CNS-139]|nr:hypothetical protein BJF78_13365 [Pseudonocardia sp. CNS-139]